MENEELDYFHDNLKKMLNPLLKSMELKGWKVLVAFHSIQPGNDGVTTITDLVGTSLELEERLRCAALVCATIVENEPK